ncbi:hypothetical protein NIES21_60640 (plasmid) [Anabaenopsis circularis NIES-21]|uniref:Uncharacterized protein n=1 Tax=Anabaenopsis circularis NIES-21 TaxID=1085406 RepID=A0A1Z4GRS0_9CYAN|nr:hypothetical protein NIES21_60640 [Anabaenopsis circularis NIES-21]
MRLIKKLLALCFLGFGVPFSMLVFLEIMNPKAAPKDKEGAVAALIIFTIPSTIIGSWLSWSLIQQSRQEQALLVASKQQRLQSLFLELIEQNAGRITVLQLAKNADISTQSAKKYLDEKALELSADFEVNENGNISYRFPL